MHDTAYLIDELVISTYAPSTAAKILEIGPQNVNGSLRDHTAQNAEYAGLDLEAGEGVDIVVGSLADSNVADGRFDLVLATSVFEHDKSFWQTFLAMCAKAKPGGHIYVSALSNGTVRRPPQDYWRFYPDSGVALEEWARSNGLEVSLVESFTAEREADVGGDFCAVFRRGPCDADLNNDFVYEKVRSTNVLTWRSATIINPTGDSEDTRLRRSALEETQRLVLHGAHLNTLHVDEPDARSQQISKDAKGLEQKALPSGAMSETLSGRDDELLVLRKRLERSIDEFERLTVETQAQERNHNRLIAEAKQVCTLARADLERSQARIKGITNDFAKTRLRLDESRDELAALSDLVAEAQDQIADLERQNNWLRDASHLLLERGKWWLRFLPFSWQRRKRNARFARRNLFDSEAYLSRYPDVASSEQDPLRHFIHHGIAENRRYD